MYPALHYLIFYGSFLVFPFLLLIGFLYYKKFQRGLMIILFLLSLLFIYARFVERYILVVNEFELGSILSNTAMQTEGEIKIAVFSDPHLGLYKDQVFLKKIVEKVNSQKPDLVLIPGDFTYEIAEKDLAEMFSPLKAIEAPVFAVTGNHDAEKPGEYPSSVIRAAISPHDVQMIDNQEATIDIKGQTIKIVGLSDLWEGKSDYKLAEKITATDNTIILTHNPDTTYKLPNQKADLMVSGHTHGGQIRIPFIYKMAIPTEHEFDQGLYTVGNLPVFVTSGVGEVGLPMRFLVPPEIAILKLKF